MDVSQISMPMRILLIGAAVFLAAWFTVLKPGGATEEIPPVTAANTTPAAAAAATPAPAQDTTVAATAIPAEVLAKLPKDVAKAIKARKTLVLGVFTDDATDYRPMADDDRYVRNALKKTNRYKGEVFAKNISVADLVDYAPLVNDLGVKQSPAVVVIDRDLKGTALTGYVDRIAINQAIADARRESIDPYITDEYLRWANDFCADYNVRGTRWSQPTIPGEKAQTKAIERMRVFIAEYASALGRRPAPAKYKRFKAAFVADAKMRVRAFAAAKKASKDGKSIPAINAALAAELDSDVALKADRYFNDLGLTTCAANRRS